MAPLARTGGLGDVLEALPAELQKRGHEVSVVLPLYRRIQEEFAPEPTGVTVAVTLGGRRMDAEIFQYTAPNGIQVFLIRRDEYFDRSGLYGTENNRNYEDNAERFIYFSSAVAELACHIKPPPDVLHLHDWQAALVPVFVKDRGLPFGTVLTIHNLAYQGSFPGSDFGFTNLPGHYFTERGVEFHGRLNCLKGGILYADAVTTVSERYAREIQTEEYGCGLDGVLREQSRKLVGILNGADYEVWNPAHDAHLPATYTAAKPAGKDVCRKKLLAELKLKPSPKGLLFAMVGRLAGQKGIDRLIPLLDRLLADDVRLVILGEGAPRFERELFVAARKYREKCAFLDRFDDALAHRINAGADVMLIPSHFEPCGLGAMYALKYGAVPLVRAAGGLYQIVQDYDPAEAVEDGRVHGNGFVYYHDSSEALWDAIRRAKRLFAEKAVWEAVRRNAMESDFSWSVSAARYEEVYRRIAPQREEKKTKPSRLQPAP